MNAIKQNISPLQSVSTAILEVPVFVYFNNDLLKFQVCNTPERPNYLQLIFTKGALAWVQLLPNRRLEFRFQKSTMLQQTINKYFEGQFFKIHFSYILPKALEYAFDKGSIWIKKGCYPIIETEKDLIITL